MAADAFNLRGWLAGGLALAAGLLWLGVLAGLGRGIDAPSGEAPALPPLPALPPAQVSPMQQSSSFQAVTAQPLFAEDRRPHPFLLDNSGGNETVSLRLTGVLITDQFGMATLTTAQNRSLRLRLDGEPVEGWQLLALEPRRATVLGPEGAQVLELVTFDGNGGEPPTVLGNGTGSTAAMSTGLVVPAPRPAARAAADDAANAAANAAASAARAAGETSSRPAPANGPSEEQMAAIRERIRARRAQLQQQQQQQSSSPPPAADNR